MIWTLHSFLWEHQTSGQKADLKDPWIDQQAATRNSKDRFIFNLIVIVTLWSLPRKMINTPEIPKLFEGQISDKYGHESWSTRPLTLASSKLEIVYGDRKKHSKDLFAKSSWKTIQIALRSLETLRDRNMSHQLAYTINMLQINWVHDWTLVF